MRSPADFGAVLPYRETEYIRMYERATAALKRLAVATRLRTGGHPRATTW